MSNLACDYGGHFRWLPAGRSLGRDVLRAREAPSALRGPDDRAAADGSRRVALPRGSAGPDVHRPRGHLRLRGRGTAVPAGPDPQGHRRRGVGSGGPRRAAAGAGPGGLPGRRVRTGPGLRGRGGALGAGLHLAAVPPGGRRLHPAERRPGARGRHRPGPRRERQVPGAGGQRPGAVRGELRDREPAGHDQDVPGPVRRAERARGGGVPLQAAGRAARFGPRRPPGRPGRRGADPGRAQRGLLRAHPAGPAHGRGAGRGPGPVLLAQPGLRAHHPGPAPRSTSSTAGWTTTSSTRCTSAPTR